jgi:uncharacterized repeat protein (TIGR01451 family)
MNTHTAPRDSAVSIAYSEAINPATVSTDTFAVHAMQTGLLTQTYGVEGGTIVLTPTELFKPGELVQASATTETLNLSGQGPISPTVWQFRAAVGGGAGTFTDSGQTTVALSGTAAALGDLNGDGALDIYAANVSFGGPHQVWLNDGKGTFYDSGWSLGSSVGENVALGDLNGDGWLDAFVANLGALDEVRLNLGGTGFAAAQSLVGSSATSYDVALGDVDGDGDLDALVGTDFGAANTLWLNNGSGGFSSSASLGTTNAKGVALGDLDGDGDLDAVLAYESASDGLWENDGRGNFSLRGSLGGSTSSDDVALGDVDGDGRLDIVVANGASGSGDSNTLWLNQGNWSFAASGESLGTLAPTRDVALGDLDGDGDLDIVFVNDTEKPDWVYLNDGGLQDGTLGAFTLKQSFGSMNSKHVDLGDVDGDGDLDVLACALLRNDVIWLNSDRANLSIAKSVNAHSVSPGQRITYTLTYSNLGPQTAKGIVISDTVPAELAGVQCSAVAGVVTPTGSFDCEWEVADLGPNQGGEVTVSGVVDTGVAVGTVFTNTAEIDSTQVADYQNDNDRSSIKVTVAHKVYLPVVVRNYP